MKKLSCNIFFSFRLDYKYTPITLIGIVLMGIIFNSCKPDHPDPGPTDLGFFGLGEAKDYVYFKKGTWWVYQNTRTGEYDTIVVFYNILDTLDRISKFWQLKDEVFAVDSRSLSTGHEYSFYEMPESVEGNLFKPRNFRLPILERREPFEGDIYPFYYPFNDKIYDFCISIKDTMTINGKIFKDVAVFFLRNDNIEPMPNDGNPAKYYWARNFGLIQKDLFDNKFAGDTSTLYHSWKLINSNIIQ